MRFNRDSNRATSKEDSITEIIVNAFEEDIKLESDADIYSDIEFDMNKDIAYDEVYENEVDEDNTEEIPVLKESQKEKKEEVNMNLKEKLQKVNQENAELVMNIETSLVDAAVKENATSKTINVSTAKAKYIARHLTDSGLKIKVTDKRDSSEIFVDWS